MCIGYNSSHSTHLFTFQNMVWKDIEFSNKGVLKYYSYINCLSLITVLSTKANSQLSIRWICDSHINQTCLAADSLHSEKICLMRIPTSAHPFRHFNNEWSLLPEPHSWVKGWCMGAQRGHIGRISRACTNGKWVMVENVDILWHLRQRENKALAFHPLSNADRVNSYRNKRVSTGFEQRREHLPWDNFLLNFRQAVKCFRNHSSALLGIEFLLHCACFA